jgi:hypothetical protein
MRNYIIKFGFRVEAENAEEAREIARGNLKDKADRKRIDIYEQIRE